MAKRKPMSAGRLLAWRAFWFWIGFPLLVSLLFLAMVMGASKTLVGIMAGAIILLPFVLIIYACWRT